MKKHGWFTLGILAVFVVASLSMPVMAEKMIQGAQDKVVTQQDAAAAERAEWIKKKDEAKAPTLVGHPVSDEAMAAFESAGRAGFEKVFGVTIPEDYKAVKADAYEEDGDVRFFLSLMPSDWEESTDTLKRQEKQPFYVIDFGGVDAQTGEGNVIGLHRFWLGWENQPIAEANYTKAQMQAMEDAARSFAEKHGFKVGELVSTNKVTGSFATGCEMTFALPDGRTVSVYISVEGAVSGYSLVESKG